MTAVTISLNYSNVPPDMWYSPRMKLFRFLIVSFMLLFQILMEFLIDADTSEIESTQYGENRPPKITYCRMFPLDNLGE